MEEIQVVYRRFGDEQSTLLDQFERLSFEVQLNQAILNRSLSDPRTYRFQRVPLQPLSSHTPPPKVVVKQEKQERPGRGSGFNRVLNKLLKPITGKKIGKNELPVPDPKNPKSWKHFSRSKLPRSGLKGDDLQNGKSIKTHEASIC
ncbi:hypothetical protein ACFE04_001940 [Oxalis oulophora]